MKVAREGKQRSGRMRWEEGRDKRAIGSGEGAAAESMRKWQGALGKLGRVTGLVPSRKCYQGAQRAVDLLAQTAHATL